MVLVGPLTAAAMLLASGAVLAQSVSNCNPNSFCAGGQCQVIPGGFINTCNCCALGGGQWRCCDNNPCSQCVGTP